MGQCLYCDSTNGLLQAIYWVTLKKVDFAHGTAEKAARKTAGATRREA